MDLREFVKETIEQVVQGVRDAQETAEQAGALVGSKMKSEVIEFDVAVVVVETTAMETSGSLKVFGVGADGSGTSTQKNQTVSRIKFPVPVVFPPPSEAARRSRPM